MSQVRLELPEIERKCPYAFPLYTTPTVFQQFAYACRVVDVLVRIAVRSLLNRKPRWGVAYQFTDGWRDSALWRSRVIRNPPGRFFADPFVVFKDGRYVLFVEDFSFADNIGRISALEVERSGAIHELGPVVQEGFHLSYPYIFDVDGVYFMCPETLKSEDIRIYRCVNFPMKWELHRILIRGIRAVDTNIFEHNGLWWMLTAVDSAGSGETCSELHVFYADHFDSDDWIAHPDNPVIFDSRRARNGGLIIDGKEIYRVFQRQGFNQYGAEVGISHIVKLEIDEYREEHIFEIPPKFFRGLKGVHTFNFDSGLLAIDFVKIQNCKN